jgi:hypothetical protein
MGKLYIIEQEDIWNEILGNLNEIDCYYTFEYGNLFAKNENGKLYAAYYEEEKTKIFYPFLKRKIPWSKETLYDIVTPYGYGGPFIQGDEEHASNFYQDFSTYCQLHNIVTETIRFHPIYYNHKPFNSLMDVQYIRRTTGVDLKLSLEEIRNQYSPMNKRNIKMAKRNNLSCFIAENNEKNIKIFINLYKETMDRNHATSFYYFDEEYFLNQVKETEISKTYLIFTKYNQEIIAGVLVIIGKVFSHYHLGASKTRFLDLKPNNLLFDFMIEFCKSKGSVALHLGGGYQENDGLFKFKSSFTNKNYFDYYLGRKIHNSTKYKEIMDYLGTEFEINEDYFPGYRANMKRKLTL